MTINERSYTEKGDAKDRKRVKSIKSIGTVWIKENLKLTRKLYYNISDNESDDELLFVFASSKNILLTISQTLLFNVMELDSCG